MASLTTQFRNYCMYCGYVVDNVSTVDPETGEADGVYGTILGKPERSYHFTKVSNYLVDGKMTTAWNVFLSFAHMKNPAVVGDFKFHPERDKIPAILNFVYFTANFDYNFIERCWENEGEPFCQHLRSKLQTTREGNFNYVSPGNVIDFIFKLSRDHQVKLLNWIEENYEGVHNF